ncbi:alpha/beta hydrolase [Mumia zhuanghuii]|uniref:Alpha/beta hydrolase n=2 Tax=Mumia TaxID=1546255 RepID=A0ABW1QNN8_9ACTN|nr:MULTISPECIES: alpha/beta hydrolase [Mumia]KAA1425153.1 alpha/beta hydrolase [Mumia zhuanghuii]
MRRLKALRHRGPVVLVAAALVALSACGSAADSRDAGLTAGTPTSAAPSADEVDPALSEFYEQDISWEKCGRYECASAEVPLDYAAPDGDRLTLKLRRLPANDPGARVGSLFINPGGPGGSGVDYVASFTAVAGDDVLDAYDVVGFDPRGVGASTPLECADTAQLDAYVNTDPTPDDASEEQAYYDAAEELGARCETQSGALAAHVSTVEVAKDLDILRAAVGDSTLHYLGASYGTMIGATYAELFPKRAGRLVLDGAIDPTIDSEGLNRGQAEGFQTALVAYLESCTSQSDCPLGDDVAAAQQKLSTFLDDLDQEPLPTSTRDRPLTEALGFYGIAVTLYVEDYWELLTRALRQAFDGNGTQLLFLADQYLSRDESGYKDNSVVALNAVNCLDDPSTLTLEQARDSQPEFTDVSPVFGRSFAWSPVTCTAWPIKPAEPAPEIDAEGAPPIVVVGTTRDPATPYQWAQAMAEQLDSGVLVSRDGDGHTGYAMGNECVDDAVDDFLVTGTPPKDGLEC